MKTALVRCAFILLALCAAGGPVHADPSPDDPLVGKWTWVMDQAYTFSADGKFVGDPGLNGTWEYMSGDVTRVYHLHFAGQKDFEKVELVRGRGKSHPYETGRVYRLGRRFEVTKTE